jgi:putative endopeptidase
MGAGAIQIPSIELLEKAVNETRDAFARSLFWRGQVLSWMSAPTKACAATKLAAFTKKIGYPDKFRDYSTLEVKDDPYATNAIRANAFQHAIAVARIGRPTDRTLWGMTPPTANAYYNPANNEVVFPADIGHSVRRPESWRALLDRLDRKRP